MDAEERKSIIEIWKTVVDVQKHFNDIEMRVRGLFITMILAISAAQGFLMDKGLAVTHGQVKILYATFIPLLGVVGTLLFYFVDRYWYHRLLIGAVNHAIKIESKFSAEIPELSLSESIGAASPVELKRWVTRALAWLTVAEPRYRKDQKLHSDGKIEIFYKSVMWMFVIVFFVTMLFAGVLVANEPLVWFLVDKVATMF
ncbi:MAG: hypothetical protein WD823_09715 [Sulfuricaulis sp.]|uniref:hypothetical protein n=1 Tax=Sulfuricaulis sp. TaxID=2003553 RepID=UPI0034A5408E